MHHYSKKGSVTFLRRPTMQLKDVPTVILMLMAVATLVPSKDPCKIPRKLTKRGNYTVAGLFPLHLYVAATGNYDFNLQAAVWAEAMIFAINEVNAKGILPRNMTLGYRIYDTCNTIATAQLSVLELPLDAELSDNAIFGQQNYNIRETYSNKTNCSCRSYHTSITSIIGGASSKISTSVSTLLGIDSIPQISYSSTSIELSIKEYYPNFLRTIPPDNFQAEFMVDILQHHGWKYINVLASDDSYGRVGVDHLLPQLTNKGICVAILAVFNTALNQDEMEDIARKLASKKAANVTVLWSGKSAARAIIRAATEVRLYGQTWIATEGWGGDEEILKSDPNVVQGIFGVIPLMKFYEPFEKHIGGKTTKDLQAYQLYYNAAKCSKSVEEQSEFCVKHHIFKNSSNILRIKIPNVVDAVYAIANGLSLLSKTTDILKNRSVAFHLNLLHTIKSHKFTGSTGMNVHFNKNGDPSTAAFSLVNTRVDKDGQLAFQIIGQWDSESRKITFFRNMKVHYAGNSSSIPSSKCADECGPGQYPLTETNKKCCWKCLVCPQGTYKPVRGNQQCNYCPDMTIPDLNRTACLHLEEKYLKFNSVHGILMITFSITGSLLSAAGVFVFLIYRGTPLVRSSNSELSILQLVMSTLCFIYPLIFVVKPTLPVCYARPLVFGVLFTISNSVIFTKADRLLRIFKINYRVKRRSVTLMLSNKFQLLIVASMASLAIFICLMSFTVSPPQVTRQINIETRSINIKCINTQLPTNLLVALVGIISLTCIVYTFKARNLPRQFREGRYIGLGMFVATLVWLFYIPVSFSGSLKELTDFAFSTAVFISNATLLLVIYGPKTWRILAHPEENNLATFRRQIATFTLQASQLPVNNADNLALKNEDG